MKLVALTIFPELLEAFWDNGIMRRAKADGIIVPTAVNIRDYAQGRHRVTDDRPYGGGCGMVMKPGPLTAAIEAAKRIAPSAPTILLSPQGQRFDQPMAKSLAGNDALVLVCGRYEGIDERFTEQFVDIEISIGDFVLTGGELPAMVIMDTVTRLLPGALGNEASAGQDSFEKQRLDHGHYTRPPEFEDKRVPKALVSGHHEMIARWRQADALMRTLVRRPDLLDEKTLDSSDKALLEKWRQEIERLTRPPCIGGADPSPGGG
jgi:tRNA (guanine37-N1)-methyltransferase